MKSRKLTDLEESNINKMIELFENGEIPSGISKQIIKKLKNIDDEVEAYIKEFIVVFLTDILLRQKDTSIKLVQLSRLFCPYTLKGRRNINEY